MIEPGARVAMRKMRGVLTVLGSQRLIAKHDTPHYQKGKEYCFIICQAADGARWPFHEDELEEVS